MPVENTGAELEKRVGAAMKLLSDNDVVSLSELNAVLAPKPTATPPPEVVPVPAVITDAQLADLKLLPQVFGSVVPTERRKITPSETTKLVEERAVLKRVSTFIGDRLEAIRLTALNHFDSVVIEEGSEGSTPRDKDGHFIKPGRIKAEAGSQEFSNEPRAGTVTLDPAKVQALLDDPELHADFSHDDWLAITTPTRYIDEHKLMLHLRKNPGLTAVLADATTTGVGSNTIQVRKPQ